MQMGNVGIFDVFFTNMAGGFCIFLPNFVFYNLRHNPFSIFFISMFVVHFISLKFTVCWINEKGVMSYSFKKDVTP